jgi:hypothetical protein
METTPPLDRFDEAYRSRSAPWVIGEPQAAIVELERADWIHRSIFGGSLAVYGREEADPVLAARDAGCF